MQPLLPRPPSWLLISLVLLAVPACAGPLLWWDHVHRREAERQTSLSRLDVAATLAVHEARSLGGDGLDPVRLADLAAAIPALVLSRGRSLYVSDPDGNVLYSSASAKIRCMADLFQDGVGREGSGERFQATRLRDGTPVVTTVRPLGGGHLTLIQPEATLAPGMGEIGAAHLALAALLGATALGAAIGCVRYRSRAGVASGETTRLAARLDTSLTHGRCGVWDWDVARERLYWSASMYGLLGYDRRGEFLSAGEAGAILQPETGDLRDLISAMSTGRDGEAEHDVRARTACGAWLWLRIKGEAVRDPVDGSPHVVVFATDVTAERTLSARRESEGSRLREALEALSEAFVLWDAEDRLILCNSRFLRLHGVPSHLAQPGTSSQAIFAASRPPIVETQISPSGPHARRIETQLSDGRWLHIHESPTRDGGTVSVGTDVSELKRREASSRERERRLQGSVQAAETAAQHFAEIAERNWEANRAKTEFLARMSHELRTPLNAIIGFSDLMRQELFGALGSARYAEYSNDIHASGQRLLAMIDRILHMSRIEKQQVSLSPELLGLDDIVGEATEAVRVEAEARSVAMVADCAFPSLLQADAPALKEAVVQLLRNAVAFSRPGGTVRVRVRSAGDHLNLYVEDAGIGIPEEIVPRLGRPFEQTDTPYCREGGGAGLGLAIARGLVEMHRGRLRIRSQLGVGTVAMLHIPVVQPAANDSLRGRGDMRTDRSRLVAAE